MAVDLGSDVTFQTFLRTLESRRTSVEADRARRVASFQARRDMELGDILNAEQNDLGDTDDEFEDRGMFRSGGRLEGRARVVRGMNQRRALSEFNLAENESEAGRGAAGELFQISQQSLAEEGAARGRIAARELAIANQARLERLAQEERSRWEAEQSFLQARYDREAAASSYGTYSGGGSTRTYSAPSYSSPSPSSPSPTYSAPARQTYSAPKPRASSLKTLSQVKKKPTTTSFRSGAKSYF